ncbi:polysaccharide biosynthesis/export family protein [Devosia sp. A8/3-2]|nr:polysaccharide biosynthesis/export family protein [Devosia sp. A8/3-2]
MREILMRWLPILIVALMPPLAGCATTSSATYLVETKGPYQLDTGDSVRVTVYGDAELSSTYRVDDAGSIAFPLVGPVQVRGTTTTGAAARLAAALSNGFMRNPNVAVEVAEYRPFFIQWRNHQCRPVPLCLRHDSACGDQHGGRLFRYGQPR